MTRDLPPLLSVRAFEACARHLSFQEAASELHVTPSAVSHQVRSLEAFLGVELFKRNHRGVTLTMDGRSYLKKLGDAFDHIAMATADVRQKKLCGKFVLGATSAFISRWILPRLDRFMSAYPRIDLKLEALGGPVDFQKQSLDMAIAIGPKEWAGLRADRIMSTPLFTLCNPHLREKLKTPKDLKGRTLLHYDQGEEWGRWLKAAGVDMDASSGPRFNDCNLLLQAAVEGHGVALSFTGLAERELTSGQLVKPFDLQVLPTAWYYVISPESSADLPKPAAVRNWILKEAQSDALKRVA
jgi:LysR family glycine cleavage system transcriptional activator